MHKIKTVNSIREVKEEEWDTLIDDNIYASYGWLKTVEETFIGDVVPKYFLVQGSNNLVGAAICYVFNKTEKVLSLDNVMLGKCMKFMAKMGVSFLPTFICCPIICYGKHFLIGKGADSNKTEVIMDEILKAVEEEASNHKLSVSFTNVMNNEIDLIQLLNKKGYYKTLGNPMTYMDIEWSSFEGYKKHVRKISKNMKECIVKEINRNRKEGVVIKGLETIDGYEDRLYELMNNNYYKYNRISFPFRREYFKKLKENLSKEAMIYISVKKDNLTGVCALLKRNKVGYASFVGVDHALAGNDATYFNITFYRPIMDAIPDQIKRLYFGTSQYELKIRRGCKISNTYVFYKPFKKIMKISIKPWFAFHSFWYKKKLSKWVKRSRRSDSTVSNSLDNSNRNEKV